MNFRPFLLLILLIVGIINTSYAINIENKSLYDAKSAGLGFTFVTLNSEGETYFFNPATLSLKKYAYFSLSFDIPYANNPTLKLSYFYPSTTLYAISADLVIDENTKQYSIKNLKGAITFPLTSYMYFGTSAIYMEETNTIKGNLGLLIKVGNFLRTGIVGEGFTLEKISDKEYKITLALRYNIGLNLSLFNNTTNIYLDLIDVEKFNDTKDLSLLRFGIEQKLGNILVIRIGSQGNLANFENYTLGFGLDLNTVTFSFSTFLENIENNSNSIDSLKLKYKLTGTLRF